MMLTFLIYHIVICNCLALSEKSVCRTANWWNSFNSEGYSQCGLTDYIRGFFRNHRRKGKEDTIKLLEEAKCCGRSSPWWNKETVIVYADWWSLLDEKNKWGECQPGYFLQGFYRSKNHRVRNIEEGRCAKPAGHPEHYGHCYNEDISKCFEKRGLCQCRENYFVTGFYKGNCDYLHCIEKLRCCKMANLEVPNELSTYKTLAMEETLYNLAKLAHYLGYGGCSGCRAQKVGENFRRVRDTWVANHERCNGKNDKRLSLDYTDWTPKMHTIIYGKPVIDYLQPETTDAGRIVNDHSTPLTAVFERQIKSIRSVTHTRSKSWKRAYELGLTISYDTMVGPSSELTFKFSYENSQTTKDSKNKQDEKLFTKSTSKVIDPFTAVEWKVLVFKQRVTTTYTAKVLLTFSTVLRGFLRGGGVSNYHIHWRGSEKELSYTFGDKNTPFWEALQKQNRYNRRPWDWLDMKDRWTYAGTVIDKLTKKKKYLFTLSGKFEDVQGYRVDIDWKSSPLNPSRRREIPISVMGGNYSVNTKNISFVARALSIDVAAPNPAAPH